MLNKETKKKIDDCRDILVGVLPLPTDQVELITITLIYKFLNDIDEQSRQIGGAVSFFRNGLKTYSWQNLMSNQLSAEERVQKFVKALEEFAKAPHFPEFFKSIFRNTFLKFRDGRVFKLFLDEINYFSYDHSEELGNAFEYLLNTMGTQGENGQFRTPRNIIDFIVEVVDPDKDDKILDPACGTAGFLISAYKHVLRKHTTGYENFRVSLNNQFLDSNGIKWGDQLSSSQKQKLAKRVEGYDNTPLMVRLSQVNMYLHRFPNPAIHDYDTITYDNRWSDKYDCILANPPFMTPKGGVKPHDQFRIRANKTEILFSDYIIEHLTPNGKAGWIVPEGIIFQNSNDYVELRKWLINDMGLWAVVSLPAQIFQPYSGVKTSILFIDRALARLTENIILVKIGNDGFSLNTNRNPIQENDLPAALNLLTEYKKNPLHFSPLSLRGDTEGFGVRAKILHRKEFAKLDSYKSTISAIDFCRKEFRSLQKAEEKYQESLQKELIDKQKQKAEERIKNYRDLFLLNTGFDKIPSDESSIKQLFEEHLKEQVILYGDNSENRVNLSSELKKYIDRQREYNLSFDKYASFLRNFNPHIEYVPLRELCSNILGGGTPSTENSEYWGGSIPWMTSADIVGIEGIKIRKYITEKGLNESATNLIPKGNIIIVTRVGLGKIVMNNFDVCISQDSHGLIVDNDIVMPRFLLYVLSQEVQKFINESRGSTIQGVTKQQLTDLVIPLPPLEVQQKIVSEIEQYQKVIDGCNLVIQNYKPTFKIDESWEKASLSEICEIDPKKKEIELSGESVVSFLPMADLGILIPTTIPEKTKSLKEVYKNYTYFQSGDVLVAKITPCFENGKMGIAKKLINNVGFGSTEFYVLRASGKAIPEFIFYSLCADDFREKGKSNMSGSAGQQRVTKEFIHNYEIYMPPIEEQKLIVGQLQSEMQAVEYCKQLKNQMENKIKEVIDSLWETNTLK